VRGGRHLLYWVPQKELNSITRQANIPRTLLHDGRSGLKHVTIFLTLNSYVLITETKLYKVALKMEVNVSIKPIQQDVEIH
jgi:hypothetical protein